MARRNISLPDDLDKQARRARLNLSALAQRAVVEELERRQRMKKLDAWLDELDIAHGTPSAEAMVQARAWLDAAVPVGPRQAVARAPRGTARRRAGKATG